MMWILQISDIHLGDERHFPITTTALRRLLIETLDRYVPQGSPLTVAICGDLTSRGSPGGFRLAENFFHALRDDVNRPISFCLCPGNHDIVGGDKDFTLFNKSAHAITGRATCLFNSKRTAAVDTIGGVDFILINSAYHGDHTFGLVDLVQAEAALRSARSAQKIVIIHHNLIPVDRTDRATILNAYQMLQLAASVQATAIFHGHVHLGTYISVGRHGTALVGAGSLFFPPRSNFNNQFNLIEIRDGRALSAHRFRLVGDVTVAGRFGDFQSETLSDV